MTTRFKLNQIEEIQNSIIKNIFNFICENVEEPLLTPSGNPRRNQDGTLKPNKKYVKLKEEVLENTQLYFFEKYEDDSLNCIEFDINEEVSKQILNKYKNNFEQSIIKHNYNIIDFDIDRQLSSQNLIMSEDETNINNLGEIKKLIEGSNHSSSDIDYSKLDFYVVKIKYNGEEILFFEKYEKSMRLDKSRLLKGTISRNQKKFNKVSNDEHFYLNYQMSCFLYNSKMYILRKPLFEKIFDYEKMYQAICQNQKNIEFITGLNLFDDVDLFKENLNVTNLNILRKFTHLMRYQVQIKILVSDIEKVKQLLIDYKVDQIKLIDNKISMSQSNFQSILKFLDRGQTEHRITHEKFESDHKVIIN